MEQDITPKSMERYFLAGKLGKLMVRIPECGAISADLNCLYHDGTNLPSFEEQTKPENIEAIVVYGSVLYRHFSHVFTIQKRKKYYLFGPEVEEKIPNPGGMPKDFDVLILMKTGLAIDKIIVPKIDVFENGYGGVDNHRVVEVTQKWKREGFGLMTTKSGANLHITYRPLEQLLNGLSNGDTISESVVRYGLPIVGRERFDEIVRNITSPKREPLHRVMWSENNVGRLEGLII